MNLRSNHLIAAFAACVALLGCALGVWAQDQLHLLRFDPSDLALSALDAYDMVSLRGCTFANVPGDPRLPALYTNVAIPFGAEAARIRVTRSTAIELPGGYYVRPAQPPFVLSAPGSLEFVGPNQRVYSSTNPYPADLVRLTGSGSKSGHCLASIVVFPVQYIPAQRKLILYTEIEFELTLGPASQEPLVVQHRTARTEKMLSDAVKALVINPEDVADHVALTVNPAPLADDAEYLIITGSDYVEEFQGLADWKTKKGVPTEIVTTSSIYSNEDYNGVDDAEEVRNCIKHYYQNHGTTYVLLGGDADLNAVIVPYRLARAYEPRVDVGCDLYYSDLNGTWNADGDGLWGEYWSDDIDMYADVFVGRAPIDDESEVETFVNKVLTYEGADGGDPLNTDYLDEIVFFTGFAGDHDEYDPSDNKDRIVDEDHSIPDGYTVTRLYEGEGTLNIDDLRTCLDNGQAFVNNASHGACDHIELDGEVYWTNDDMDLLQNGGQYGAWASVSCFIGHLSEADAVAEHWLNNPDGGGIGFLCNDQMGAGSPDGEYSEAFDRAFFKAIFLGNYEDHHKQARATGECKDRYVSEAKDPNYGDTWRYCLYELNMLGDAELPYWTDEPQELDVDHPDDLPNVQATFEVHVESEGSDLPGATVCLWKGDEVYLVDTTDGAGDVSFEPSPSTGGTMYVTVTKHNYLPCEAQAEVLVCETTTAPDPEPYCADGLFCEPNGGYPGWVWFSAPLEPYKCCGDDECADPNVLLGFWCNGNLWRWDKYAKNTQVYNPPFADWTLAVGESYLLQLTSAVDNPTYKGLEPDSGFSFLMGKAGWTWVGMPGSESLGYPDFMTDVSVQYPIGGSIRTAQEDKANAQPWLSWGWSFWDTYGQYARALTPYLPFGCNTAYPWIGYRAYVNVGTAEDEEDTDQVTLIWPSS